MVSSFLSYTLSYTLSPPFLYTQLGSARLIPTVTSTGSKTKVLNGDGYDDGGVGDLTLIIDLEDHVLRRKRGDTAYFTAVKSDILPRIKHGQLAQLSRRDQKVHLAKILFSDEEAQEEEEMVHNPAEIYQDQTMPLEEATRQQRYQRLKAAKSALNLSQLLGEPACLAIALAEISKRTLLLYGKEKADVALRCADKCLLLASDQYYDTDEIMMEVCQCLCEVFDSAWRCFDSSLTLLSSHTLRRPKTNQLSTQSTRPTQRLQA